MNSQNESSNRSGTWILGGILVLLGIVFLLQNFMNISFGNWWALFILIPAFGSFNNAYRSYNDAGKQITPHARSSFMWGILLSLITAILLFNLNWSLLGPVVLILLGLGILLNVMMK
jgi:hypothetical protein